METAQEPGATRQKRRGSAGCSVEPRILRGPTDRESPAAAERELEPAEQALFETLRVLRRTIAGELSVPPHVH